MFPLDRQSEVQELRSHLRATREAQEEFERRTTDVAPQVQQLEAERAKLDAEAQGYETRARGIEGGALPREPAVRELLPALNVGDAQAPESPLRAQTSAEEARRIAERHPGLIGQNLDWPARQMEFQRVYSEWRERHTVAVEARRRAGAELPPRLEQLKHDISRYKEVPDVIKAGQNAEESMRREESMAERARSRQRTFLGAMLGGLLLAALAILVAFLALQGGMPLYLSGAAFFLLGMGVLSTGIGIWVRGAAVREVDRRLKAKDDARVKRREILQPWGVRSSGELQQALVEHLQKVRYDATRLELDRRARRAISSPAARPPGPPSKSVPASNSSTRSWNNCGRPGSGRLPSVTKRRTTRASSPRSTRRRESPSPTWSAPPRPGTRRWATLKPTGLRVPDSRRWRANAAPRPLTRGRRFDSWSRICRASWTTSAAASTRFGLPSSAPCRWPSSNDSATSTGAPRSEPRKSGRGPRNL